MSESPSKLSAFGARSGLRAGSLLISAAAATLLVATLWARSYNGSLPSILLALVLAALCVAIGLHLRFLVLMKREHRHTEDALDLTELEFKSIFDNALDAIFILDDQGGCVRANPAAEQLFGAHPFVKHGNKNGSIRAGGDDLPRIWKKILARGIEHGETALTQSNDEIIFVEYSAKMNYLPGRHLAVLRDVTSRKLAEQQVARNLTLAEGARAEADALRNITLALTQNLSMDYVLDTLLQSLVKLIPAETASVMLCETETRLFVAREVHHYKSRCQVQADTETIDTAGNSYLKTVIGTKNALFISDTSAEGDWHSVIKNSHLGSWLCVPLMAANQVLGLLSLGHTEAGAFNQEDLRVAKSLAIPAAVAIQNARLYERASIYGIELEQRLSELSNTQRALRRVETSLRPNKL